MKDSINVRIDRELWEIIWSRSRRFQRSASGELSFIVRQALLAEAIPFDAATDSMLRPPAPLVKRPEP